MGGIDLIGYDTLLPKPVQMLGPMILNFGLEELMPWLGLILSPIEEVVETLKLNAQAFNQEDSLSVDTPSCNLWKIQSIFY